MTVTTLRSARVPGDDSVQSDVLPGGYYVEVDLEDHRVMIAEHKAEDDGEGGTMGLLHFTWTSFEALVAEVGLLSGRRMDGVSAVECGSARIEYNMRAAEPAMFEEVSFDEAGEARDLLFQQLAAAYVTGARAVHHDHCFNDPEPDFTGAAHDYARAMMEGLGR